MEYRRGCRYHSRNHHRLLPRLPKETRLSVNIEGLSAQQLSDLISRANQRKKVLAKRKPAFKGK